MKVCLENNILEIKVLLHIFIATVKTCPKSKQNNR